MMTPSSKQLTSSIQMKIDYLPSIPYNPCIYRIPKYLRSVNEKAYTPCRIAIGPYHAHDPALMPMEQHKLRCLQDLISRSTLKLEDYVAEISSEAVLNRARQYYADIPEKFNNDDVLFAEMLLTDAAFIIQYFLSFFNNDGPNNVNMLLRNERIMMEIMRDLLILENQLPYFILEHLFKLAMIQNNNNNNNQSSSSSSFLQLTAAFILGLIVPIERGKHLEPDVVIGRTAASTEIMHLVHLMILLLEEQPTEVASNANNSRAVEPSEAAGSTNLFHQASLSATELHDAGVTFRRKSPDRKSLKIRFSNGVLELPHLMLAELTESFFRNLMAFEQYYLNTFYVTSYMYFMDHLIDTVKDVHILQESDVVDNWLECKDNVTTVFNAISKHTITNFSPELRQVINDMKQHAGRPWNIWMAKLRRDYFGSPWAVISFLAALTLLLLTFLQTFASLRQQGQS